jgi:hypothetical protein
MYHQFPLLWIKDNLAHRFLERFIGIDHVERFASQRLPERPQPTLHIRPRQRVPAFSKDPETLSGFF